MGTIRVFRVDERVGVVIHTVVALSGAQSSLRAAAGAVGVSGVDPAVAVVVHTVATPADAHTIHAVFVGLASRA